MAQQPQQQFGVKQVVRMMVDVSKKPSNKITVKLKGFIISVDEYPKQDGSKGYRYVFTDDFSDGLITFTSSRLLKKREPAEVMLVLDGFTAYEPAPRGGAAAVLVAPGLK